MTKKKTKASVAPEVAVVAPPPAAAAVVPVVTSVAAPQTTPPEVDFITQEDSFSYGKPDVNPASKKEARPQWLVAQHEADFPLAVGAAAPSPPAGAAAAEVAPAEAAAPSSKPASGGTGSRASRVKAPASAITIKPARSGAAVVAADASLVPPPRAQQAASPASGAARGQPKQPASTETTRLHFDEPFEQQIQAGIPMGDDFECDVNGHY